VPGGTSGSWCVARASWAMTSSLPGHARTHRPASSRPVLGQRGGRELDVTDVGGPALRRSRRVHGFSDEQSLAHCGYQERRVAANGKRRWALASKTDRALKAHSRRHGLAVRSVLPIAVDAGADLRRRACHSPSPLRLRCWARDRDRRRLSMAFSEGLSDSGLSCTPAQSATSACATTWFGVIRTSSSPGTALRRPYSSARAAPM
jgi:hypothetical protein